VPNCKSFLVTEAERKRVRQRRSLIAVTCFLPGRAKDLSAPLVLSVASSFASIFKYVLKEISKKGQVLCNNTYQVVCAVNKSTSRTCLPTQWRRVLLEKLTSFQLVKKFPAFNGTQRFITAFTSA